jgi:hypothetical protein
MSIPRFRKHHPDDGPCYDDHIHSGLDRKVIPRYAVDAIDPLAERFHKQGHIDPHNIKKR